MRLWTTIFMLLALTVPALANGAMGLGLKVFDLRYWFVYVAATVVFEAWMIGRWMGKSWIAAIGWSVLANAITAFFCVNMCAPILHLHALNPNPFFDVARLFLVFGVVSALLESLVWHGLRPTAVLRGSIFLRTIYAHLLGVPFGLAILLVPDRPYVGTETLTYHERRIEIMTTLVKRIQMIDDKGKLPDFRTFPEVWAHLPTLDMRRDTWAAAYRPSYGRFATGESKEVPFGEWNTELSGKPVQFLYDHAPVWLVRWRNPGGTVNGVIFDPQSTRHGYTSDPKLLGYAANPDQSPR